MGYTAIVCCLLVALVSANSDYQRQPSWKTNIEYRYRVESRALTALHDIKDQYAGIILRAELVIQPREDSLIARIENTQFTEVHSILPSGWESEIPESQLAWRPYQMTERPFEVRMKNGVVREILVEKDTPVWDVNVIKSFVSQLQVDLNGANLMSSSYNQKPENDNNAVYKTMEDTVTGKCETLYDVHPLAPHQLFKNPEMAPLSQLKKEGQFIAVVKSKDYKNCDQYNQVSIGLNHQKSWNDKKGIFSQSTVSEIVISGTMQRNTIHSAVTRNVITVNPVEYNSLKGQVVSKVNVTLMAYEERQHELEQLSAPQSVGNLVYGIHASNDKQRLQSDENLNIDSTEDRFLPNHIRSVRNRRAADNLEWGRQARDSSSSEEDASDEHHLSDEKDYMNEPVSPISSFIGNHQHVDQVAIAQKVIDQIVHDIKKSPSNLAKEHTLMKFVQLRRLVAKMTAPELNKLTHKYQFNKQQNVDSDEHVLAWKIYRDAVVSVGNGPQLRTIKEWIQSKKVEGMEAAQVISDLSRTASEVTNQYMKEFWALIKLPEVQSQPIVYHYAILTFASLTRKVLFTRENSQSHFMHKFGREQVENQKRFTFEKFIPYLEKQLTKAIEEHNRQEAQVYIRALGNVAHPKILAVFEPYLEGKRPASEFQRFLMVSFLEKLAVTYPTEAQSVLFKIYSNTGEAHQLRCAAVRNLMRTRPSADLLQRMAQLTKTEPSIEVRSTVKSAIESAAQADTPKFAKLAEAAKMAAKLLDPEVYPAEYSASYLLSTYDHELEYGYNADVEYNYRRDSDLPNYFNFNLNGFFGKQQHNYISIGAMVSSALDITKIFDEESYQDSQFQGQAWMNKIQKMLDIKYDAHKKVEGNLFVRLFGIDNFVTFDNHTIEKLMQEAARTIPAAKQGKQFSLTKLYQRNNVRVLIPLEAGLPFTYTMETPTILYLKGNMKLSTVPEITAQDNQEMRMPESIKMTSELELLAGTTLAIEMGFLLPKEGHRYIAAYDQQMQVYAPIRAKIDVDAKKNEFQVELEPLYTKEHNKIAEYSTWPYTTKVSMVEAKPAALSTDKLPMRSDEPRYFETILGQKESGMAVLFKHYSEDKYNKWSFMRIISEIQNGKFLALTSDQLLHTKTVLEYVGEQGRKVALKVNAAQLNYYDAKYIKENKKDLETQEHKLSREHNQEQLHKLEALRTDEQQREAYLFNGAIKGIQNPKVSVINAVVRIEGGRKHPQEFIASLAYSYNETQEASRVLLYAAKQENSEQKPYQVYLSAEQRVPQPVVMNFVEALKAKPTMKTHYYITFSGSEGVDSTVHVYVNQKQSEEHRQKLKESDYTKLCAQQMDEQNYILPACINATYRAQLMDRARVELDWDKSAFQQINQYSEMARALYSYVHHYHPYITVINKERKLQEQSKVALDLEYLPNSFDTVNVTYYTPSGHVYYEDVPVPQWTHPILIAHPRYNFAERLAIYMNRRHHVKSVAVLDSTSVTTFNNRTFNVFLGNCYHVFAQANIKRLAESDRQGLSAITVLVRDSSESQTRRDIKVIVNNEQGQETVIDIEARKTEQQQLPVGLIKINKQETELKQHKPIYVHVSSAQQESEYAQDATVAEIYALANGNVYVRIGDFIKVEYDGKRVKIGADDLLKGQIRGIAGPFSNEPYVDFIAPRDCLLKDARDFVASYALADETCQGPAKDLYARAQKARCEKRTTMYVNVVSERDSRSQKKTVEECLKHQTRYIVDRDENQVCFTTRPMPRCSQRCSPAGEQLTKRVDVYCIPKSGPVTLYMKQIDNGASPDFSLKPATKTMEVRVPKACY